MMKTKMDNLKADFSWIVMKILIVTLKIKEKEKVKEKYQYL